MGKKFARFMPPYLLTKQSESTKRLYFVFHIKVPRDALLGMKTISRQCADLRLQHY